MSRCTAGRIPEAWDRSLLDDRKSILILLIVLLWGGVAASHAQERPIFDAHIHYSQPDWQALTPEQALAILDRAGVRRALVSSTPDDGTLKLYEQAPRRITAFLRPYRTREDMGTWHSDPAVQAYVEERLKRGIYKGIGEFHLLAVDQAAAPVVKRCAELAAAQQLFLHAHVDDRTMEKLLQLYPQVRILWAHAGMTASAATVGRLLDRFPTLWVELALRSDVAPNSQLDPEWRSVFLRHSDSFMVGTDTWVTSRWESLEEGIRFIRGWLGQLPHDVAERIAYQNAERLFGSP
jgi:predicted TIM-barrel fold metal-dependent hydrolase